MLGVSNNVTLGNNQVNVPQQSPHSNPHAMTGKCLRICAQSSVYFCSFDFGNTDRQLVNGGFFK